jgi:hypothetical protein
MLYVSSDLGNWVNERLVTLQREAISDRPAQYKTTYLRPFWMRKAATQLAHILSFIVYRLEHYSGIPA